MFRIASVLVSQPVNTFVLLTISHECELHGPITLLKSLYSNPDVKYLTKIKVGTETKDVEFEVVKI